MLLKVTKSLGAFYSHTAFPFWLNLCIIKRRQHGICCVFLYNWCRMLIHKFQELKQSVLPFLLWLYIMRVEAAQNKQRDVCRGLSWLMMVITLTSLCYNKQHRKEKVWSVCKRWHKQESVMCDVKLTPGTHTRICIKYAHRCTCAEKNQPKSAGSSPPCVEKSHTQSHRLLKSSWLWDDKSWKLDGLPLLCSTNGSQRTHRHTHMHANGL